MFRKRLPDKNWNNLKYYLRDDFNVEFFFGDYQYLFFNITSLFKLSIIICTNE